jgi:hypothetical protein
LSWIFLTGKKGWDLSDSMEAKQTAKAFINAVRSFIELVA